MSSIHTLTIHHTVPAPVTAIYSYFLDFEKFAALHPYMKEAKKLDTDFYFIREELALFGIFPMKPCYKVKVTELGGEICYTSDVRKGVDLTIRLNFREDALSGKTFITEVFEVKANRLISAVFMNILEKSHKILVENLIKTVKK